MTPKPPKPVVLVTGASRGIGLAVVRILLDDLDAIVVTLSRTRTPELRELLSKHISTLMVIDCDVTDETALATAISTVSKTYQRLDGLILNAGTLGELKKISSPTLSLADWKLTFDVNFFSLVQTLNICTPLLKSSIFGGRVIFVSSGAATGGIATWGAYSASKAAMNSLARTFANEEPDIVSVAVRPGAVDTDMQGVLRATGPGAMNPTDISRFIQMHEAGTLVKPEDTGYVIASLALKAPKSLSGAFVSWDKEECEEFRRPVQKAEE
ncbi:NAD(P)-binding protein [Sistotremastrum niveocremeum HHB9708]|uniref:NAD(P)-binding protein n=2 Tax=Sistotremastraceae TaxID=3402574 RepID=A0A164ZTP2_9AGAM|nr:NAD(P)-binding protein [Sistotremastrum niveocremeum HHB9708]KZT38337.1 NAD(P)-binding protein [Sistotremastrum suecicum HHB10207 ss-3]